MEKQYQVGLGGGGGKGGGVIRRQMTIHSDPGFSIVAKINPTPYWRGLGVWEKGSSGNCGECLGGYIAQGHWTKLTLQNQ